ncbi:peroxidase family protein [Leptothoe sp. LEGE 181152]|nr:peroxidase family protein [Leptothoe sp. LEGE 181152]
MSSPFLSNNTSRFSSGVDPLTGQSSALQAFFAATQAATEAGLPDLTTTLQSVGLKDRLVPGATGKLKVTLSNQGGSNLRDKVTLTAYAAPIDNHDAAIEIGQTILKKLSLKENQSREFSLKVNLPKDVSAGDYQVFVVANAENGQWDANPLNNIAVESAPRQVVWQFGNIPGYGHNVPLRVTDSRGKETLFSLRGPGYGEIIGGSDFSEIILYGTDASSRFSINGKANTRVGQIRVNGSLDRIRATSVDLYGGLSVSGSLREIKMDDWIGPQTVEIGHDDAIGAVRHIELDEVNDVTLSSQTALGFVKSDSWTDIDGQADEIVAPSLRYLRVRGDSDADVSVAGHLGQAEVYGDVTGTWQAGSADKLRLGDDAVDWSLDVDGDLNKIDLKGNLSGTIAADTINRVHIKGDVIDSAILAGADLGADGRLGGGDDSFEAGTLKRIGVNGTVSNSVIAAGLDPVDDETLNGSERLIADSTMGRVDIRTLSDDSRIGATEFGSHQKINGRYVTPADDDRYLTPDKVQTDGDAPVLTLALQSDTGRDATDGITQTPTLVGTVNDASDLARVTVSVGETNLDITDQVQPDGSFTLDETVLEALVGSALIDGSYEIAVIAEDVLGNGAEPVRVSMTLDRTAAEVVLLSPLVEGTHSSNVHLLGRTSEAGTLSTTLDDGTAVDVEIIDTLDQALQALPLEDGAHQLTVRFHDVAGNVTEQIIDFEVDGSDFVIGATETTGFAATTDDEILLAEGNSFVTQAQLPVSLGQEEGRRMLRLAVDANFDTTDETSVSSDTLAVYLVSSTDSGQTLLDNGTPGTPVFSLTGDTADFTPGLVTYDGQFVEIDLMALDTETEGTLVFQLLNQDGDTGSRIHISQLTNTVDPEGTEALRFEISDTVVTLGGELALETLLASTSIEPVFSQIRFNAETGDYTAQLQLRNTGDTSISRQAVVVFDALPDGVSLETLSGTDGDGNPYVNLYHAIRPGGLAAGALSDAVEISVSNLEQLQLILNPQVLVGGPNQAPVFEPIDPIEVMPGQRIEIPLNAVDPNGDRVTYSLRTDIDLPNGRLDGTGTLSFEPSPNDIGFYSFTVIASDGTESVEQTVTLNVVPDPVTTTRISGRVLDTNGAPLANLPIELGRLQTVTDSEGYFILTIPDTSFPTDELDIDIPFGDRAFDPFFTGTQVIDLRRTTFDGTTGTDISNPLRHPNLVSAYMNASMVYGNDTRTADALRTLDGTGQLKVSENNLLPLNNTDFFPGGPLPNSNRSLNDPATLFATGDVRANENMGLTAMHTVFVREHNRLATEIQSANPDLSGDEIYNRARKQVAAQIQHITYREYLPLLIGSDTLETYTGYDEMADPAISHLFSAAAFRMGHTQSFSEFLLVDDNGEALPSVSLRESTFNPEIIHQYGIDAILRGLYAQSAEAIDTKVIDELRNTLFGPPGAGGIDLAAVDIERGRDVGLPDYNQARMDMGLAPVTSFAEITSDTAVQAVLEQLYGTVDDIDVIVGGLAEDHVPGAMVGELFQTIIADQFMRLRDGDRFWYENGQFTQAELDNIRGTTLASLIQRNTDITSLSDYVFSNQGAPTAPEAAGTVASATVIEFGAIDGSGHGQPGQGLPGDLMGVNYTQEYGDGIRSVAGENRPNTRDISNALFAQTESIPDAQGGTGFMLAWSQFMGHDLSFSPAGAADTLKFYGTEYESSTGEEFPYVAEKIDLVLGHSLYAGVNNVIERPIYLPALDIANNQQTTDSQGNLTVTNDTLGAEVFVTAGALSDREGNPFDGQLTISEVPPDLTPAVLPENLAPDLVVTIQPGEMAFETPAQLTLPNRAGWAAGVEMDLWSINPTTGDFEIVGKGRVTDDGQSVETIEGGIRNSSWHMFVPPPFVAPSVLFNLYPGINHGCHTCEATAPLTSNASLSTGGVVEDHHLVTYQSQGTTRGVQLVYDSLRADPRPIVQFSYENLDIDNLVPLSERNTPRLVASLSIEGNGITYQLPGYDGDALGLNGGEHFWRLPDNDEPVTAALQADLSTFDSGVYDYNLRSGIYTRQLVNNQLQFMGSSLTSRNQIIHVNTVDSALGSGWGIAGVQNLVLNRDGSVLLIDGDGTELLFEAQGNGQYSPPPGDFSELVQLSDGTFQRILKDQTVYQFDDSNRLISVVDRQGNTTQHSYSTAGQLTTITDPVGLATTFTYTAQGKVSSITDPTGRVTQLDYDADGNLTRITDPDDSQRQFNYDDGHHMTGETDKRGYQEVAEYNNAGRAIKAITKDGSVIQVEASETLGLLSTEATSSILEAPTLVAVEDTRQATYRDGNGNVIRYQLDNAGQIIVREDGEGDSGSITRNSRNLITQRESTTELTWTYTYDEQGNVTTIVDGDDVTTTTTTSDNSIDFSDWSTIAVSAGELKQSLVQDINSDGNADIAFDQNLVLLSNGEGVFSPRTVGDSLFFGDVILADFDGDGQPDRLNGQDLRLGGGDGSFGEGLPLDLYYNVGDSTPAAVGDLDGDDDIDFIDQGSGSGLVIQLNNGDGSFDEGTYLRGTSFRSPTAVDINGDSILDIVAERGSEIIVLQGAGDGTTFTEIGRYQAGYSDKTVLGIADFNGDDTPDIYGATDYSDSGIFLNTGTGSFLTDTIGMAQDIVPSASAIGDLDGDGDIDILDVTDPGSNANGLATLNIRLNDGQGTFSDSREILLPDSLQTRFNRDDIRTAVGDVDGDGDLDILLGDESLLFVALNRPDEEIVITNGRERSYTYDETFSQLTSVTDELGRQTLYELDDQGNRITATRVVGQLDSASSGPNDDVITRYTYTNSGQLDTMLDALGRETDYDYDLYGNLIQITAALGTDDEAIQQFEYDAAGNQTAVIDANGNRTEYAYDILNRIVQITEADPNGASGVAAPITQFAYDAAGNLQRTVDARNNETAYVYDEKGRVLEWTDADGGTTRNTYDESGNLVRVVNALGQTTRYDYDSRNRRIAVTDAAGNTTRFHYDQSNNLIASIDALGNRTEFDYDKRNRLITETDALGHTTQYQYDATNNLVALTDRRGNSDTYVYDDLNRLTQITDALGGTQAFSYDAVGNRLASTDERNNTTAYQYDALNRLAETTDALGGTISYTYDDVGNRLSTTDELGRTTRYGYDALNRLVQITDPLNHSTTFGYDAVGNQTRITDALGRTTRYGYDELNRQVSRINAVGDISTSRYDALGNVIATTDELGRTTSFEYDSRNWLTQVQDPLGQVTSRGYDAVGNLTALMDALGNTVQYTYDSLYRQTVITDATGAETAMTYDAEGNLLSLTDASQNQTTYAYDALNRQITDSITVDNETLTRHYRYDAVGNLTGMEDRNGRETVFTYDALNRQTQEQWVDAQNNSLREIDYTFDAASQLLSLSDPDANYTYAYDDAGRLTSVSNVGTTGVPEVTFTYGYDAVNNLTSVDDAINGVQAGTEAFSYDALDRVTRITQSGHGVAQKQVDMAYDAASQMTGLSRYSDLAGTQSVAETVYDYDAAGRLTDLTHQRETSVIADYGLSYDAANRLTQLVTPDGTSDYGYNNRDELTNTDHSYQTDEAYDYDATGNRTTSTTGEHNRILEDGTYTYEYDNEGNRTRRIEIATGEVTDYTWDQRNRLTAVVTTDSDGTVLTEAAYTYDAYDRRIAKVVDADGDGAEAPTEERFVYDGDHIALVFDGEGNQTHRYLHGPQVDQVLAEETADGETRWALTDHQGTVRDVIDNQGTVLNHITYDSFGQVTSETNLDIDFRFGYTGRELDDETGLMYYRARYFDPAVGTFVSEDPLGFDAGDANVYRYVFNSPTNFTDPSGNIATRIVQQGAFGLLRRGGTQVLSKVGALGSRVLGPVGALIAAGDIINAGSTYDDSWYREPTPRYRGDIDGDNRVRRANANKTITAVDPREFDPNWGARTQSPPIRLPDNTASPRTNVEGLNENGLLGGGFCEGLADILDGLADVFPIPQIDPRDFILDINLGDSIWEQFDDDEASQRGFDAEAGKITNPGSWITPESKSRERYIADHYGNHGKYVGAHDPQEYVDISERFKKKVISNKISPTRIIPGPTPNTREYVIGDTYIWIGGNNEIVSFGEVWH